MMEIANTSLDHDEIGKLVDQMFVTSGLERSNSLRFRDFTRVLNDKMEMMWYVCLDWKGTKFCMPEKKPFNKRYLKKTHITSVN